MEGGGELSLLFIYLFMYIIIIREVEVKIGIPRPQRLFRTAPLPSIYLYVLFLHNE